MSHERSRRRCPWIYELIKRDRVAAGRMRARRHPKYRSISRFSRAFRGAQIPREANLAAFPASPRYLWAKKALAGPNGLCAGRESNGLAALAQPGKQLRFNPVPRVGCALEAY